MPHTPPHVRSRAIAVGRQGLPGTLALPHRPRGLVIFAHGSGSSRLSPRNTRVAVAFNRAGLATLLFDLLTDAEAADRGNVFDIALLGARMREAIAWAGDDDDTSALPVLLFGASTGAAAALVAAATSRRTIAAVVSRGGRPDLAGSLLAEVRAPTLLVVGGDDHGVITLNEDALAKLRCEKRLAIVPGATHLFEEPGTLDQVVALASAWFLSHVA